MTVSVAPRERIVVVGSLEVFVRERGDGRPLLLVNGLGGNLDMWGAAEERLSAVAHTIAFDAPGTGRSSMPLWPLTIAALAGIVGNVLDELDHAQVDVLGFSLGGIIAQELARQQPGRIRRLALVASACGWGSMPGTAEALTLASMPLRYHSRVLYEQTKRLLPPADAAVVDRLTGLSEARLRYPPSPLAYMWQIWAGALWSSLPWLAEVRMPTLVLHGAADELVPSANAVQLARLLPESRLHILSGEGHLLVFDPQGGALPLLEDFFGSARLGDSRAWATGKPGRARSGR